MLRYKTKTRPNLVAL